MALDGFGAAGAGNLSKFGYSKLSPYFSSQAIATTAGTNVTKVASWQGGFANVVDEITVKPALRLSGQSLVAQAGKQGINFADDAGQKLLPAPKTIARHHIFPQEFKPYFKNAGININNYTIEMEHFSTHLKGIHGNGLGNMPGKWNLRWDEFIKANPKANASEIFKFGEDLMSEYGFRFSRFIKYR